MGFTKYYILYNYAVNISLLDNIICNLADEVYCKETKIVFENCKIYTFTVYVTLSVSLSLSVLCMYCILCKNVLCSNKY